MAGEPGLMAELPDKSRSCKGAKLYSVCYMEGKIHFPGRVPGMGTASGFVV